MRTPEQAAADAAVEKAIHQWNEAYYGADSDDGVVRVWTLVAEFAKYDQEGEVRTAVLIAAPAGLSTPHQIGLLRQGVVRIESVAAASFWRSED